MANDKNQIPVTEIDFRKPEFRDAKVEDYERRDDGAIVRKDRWKRAVESIRFLVGVDGGEYEIPEVVAAVEILSADQRGWQEPDNGQFFSKDDLPPNGATVDVRLEDDSILRKVTHIRKNEHWLWNGAPVPLRVVAWKERRAASAAA